MENTTVNKNDFSTLTDGDSGKISPNLLDDIRFGNQRDDRDEDEFKDLVSSVRVHGIIQPVTVWSHNKDNTRLELICGHGRRDAALQANTESIPFIFREVSEQQAFEMHLAENLERESLGVVAKAKAIQHYLTRYQGDYEATASKLNLKVKECRELIELNKCCDAVMKSIKNKSISPAHAIILAPFPHQAQEKNLNTIVAEGWTVKTLRERAGKAKLPLDKGIFDKEECSSCKFNTNPQLGLFNITETKAQCAKPTCFQEKTTKHLALQKSAIEEKYGKVLLLSECDTKSQNTVGIENVGNEQYASCISCDHRVAVLHDSWSKAGQITESQCSNPECFKTCITAHSATIKKESTTPEKVTKSETTPKAKTVKPQGVLSPSIITRYENELRNSAKLYFKNHDNFKDALTTASLINQSGYKFSKECTTKLNDALVFCLHLSCEELATIRNKATEEFLNNSEVDANHNRVTKTLIRCLNKEGEKAEKFVIEQWKPIDENLKIYTIEILKQLAIGAGVDKVMELASKDSFAKLMKQGKGAIIKGIQKVSIDWKGYAPRNLKEFLKKGEK